jgi:hypothetical protein
LVDNVHYVEKRDTIPPLFNRSRYAETLEDTFSIRARILEDAKREHAEFKRRYQPTLKHQLTTRLAENFVQDTVCMKFVGSTVHPSEHQPITAIAVRIYFVVILCFSSRYDYFQVRRIRLDVCNG